MTCTPIDPRSIEYAFVSVYYCEIYTLEDTLIFPVLRYCGAAGYLYYAVGVVYRFSNEFLQIFIMY